MTTSSPREGDTKLFAIVQILWHNPYTLEAAKANALPWHEFIFGVVTKGKEEG